MVALFFVLGLLFGYVSLALGPLGLIEALIVLGIVLWQVRRSPERSGAYLVGLSLLPVILLSVIVSRFPACSGTSTTGCYASSAVPALAAFAIAGVVGLILLGTTLRRLVATPSQTLAAVTGKGDQTRRPGDKTRRSGDKTRGPGDKTRGSGDKTLGPGDKTLVP